MMELVSDYAVADRRGDAPVEFRGVLRSKHCNGLHVLRFEARETLWLGAREAGLRILRVTTFLQELGGKRCRLSG